MSKVATLTLSLSVQGDGVNTAWAPATPIANSASPGVVTPYSFSGSTTQEYAVPTGAIGMVIAPTPGNQVALTVLFASSDTGGPIATNEPSPFCWEGAASPPANVWLKAAGATTGLIYWL